MDSHPKKRAVGGRRKRAHGKSSRGTGQLEERAVVSRVLAIPPQQSAVRGYRQKKKNMAGPSQVGNPIPHFFLQVQSS